jgi:hypothetical protein
VETNEKKEDYEDLEYRLKFLHKVLAPDDIFEFMDILLQMNFCLSNVLNEFSNLDTVFAVYPEAYKTVKNLVEFRLRMRHKDTRMIQLEKFNLYN